MMFDLDTHDTYSEAGYADNTAVLFCTAPEVNDTDTDESGDESGVLEGTEEMVQAVNDALVSPICYSKSPHSCLPHSLDHNS